MNNYTVVVAIDQRTVRSLEVTLPNWKEHAPQLFDQPWAVVYDSKFFDRGFESFIGDFPDIAGIAEGHAWYGSSQYKSQREKMLTAHVHVSKVIDTKYSLKIDCDAFLNRPSPEFPKAEWFQGDPVLVGSPWGYTRAKGGGGDLANWLERLELFGDRVYGTPRAGWLHKITDHNHPRGPKMKETRLASWVCFQDTQWVRDACRDFDRVFGTGKLPVPSHDTSLWAAAVRSNQPIKYVRMKNEGWENRTTTKGLREAIEGLK